MDVKEKSPHKSRSCNDGNMGKHCIMVWIIVLLFSNFRVWLEIMHIGILINVIIYIVACILGLSFLMFVFLCLCFTFVTKLTCLCHENEVSQQIRKIQRQIQRQRKLDNKFHHINSVIHGCIDLDYNMTINRFACNWYLYFIAHA